SSAVKQLGRKCFKQMTGLLCEECPEGSLADFEGFEYAEASAPFLRRHGIPCLQVCFLAKEVHERAARLRDTAPIPFGKPHHQSRRCSSFEHTFRNIDGHGHGAKKNM